MLIKIEINYYLKLIISNTAKVIVYSHIFVSYNISNYNNPSYLSSEPYEWP